MLPLITTPASADVFQVTITGQVAADSYDQIGLFNPPGSPGVYSEPPLSGPFTIVFMFDSNAPGAERITAPTWDQVSNGVLSVSVTINGRSANIADPMVTCRLGTRAMAI